MDCGSNQAQACPPKGHSCFSIYFNVYDESYLFLTSLQGAAERMTSHHTRDMEKEEKKILVLSPPLSGQVI